MTQDLESRLRRHGEVLADTQADPPPLAPMIRVASGHGPARASWGPIALAAVVVVVVATIPVLLRIAGPSSDRPSAAPAAIPATVTVNGVVETLVGTEGWTAPVADETAPDVVWVYAEIQGGPSCLWTPVPYVVAATATAVTIKIATYVRPATSTTYQPAVCVDVKRPSQRLKVTLGAPLAGRKLVDAFDGSSHPVLDPATVPAPTTVPAGYVARPVAWSSLNGFATGFGKEANAGIRTYAGAAGTVSISAGPAASLGGNLPEVLRRTTVHGHPAVASADRGFEQDILVVWTEAPDRAFAVHQMSNDDPKHPALTLDEVIAFANSLN
ncbi:MAG: hypothetical protein ABJA87_12870 [bacterium]